MQQVLDGALLLVNVRCTNDIILYMCVLVHSHLVFYSSFSYSFVSILYLVYPLIAPLLAAHVEVLQGSSLEAKSENHLADFSSSDDLGSLGSLGSRAELRAWIGKRSDHILIIPHPFFWEIWWKDMERSWIIWSYAAPPFKSYNSGRSSFFPICNDHEMVFFFMSSGCHQVGSCLGCITALLAGSSSTSKGEIPPGTGGFLTWCYPKLAGWFRSWEIPIENLDDLEVHPF